MDVIQPTSLVLQKLISLPSTRSTVHILSIWIVQRMALQLLITVEFESLKNITRESKRKWWKHDVDTLPETNKRMEYPPFWWYLPGQMEIFMGYVSFREGITCRFSPCL